MFQTYEFEILSVGICKLMRASFIACPFLVRPYAKRALLYFLIIADSMSCGTVRHV
jgi:hypothetical protein